MKQSISSSAFAPAYVPATNPRIILSFLVSYPTLLRFMPISYEVERLQKLLY